MSNELFAQMAQSIIEGEAEDAARLAHQAIERNIEPVEAINKGATPISSRQFLTQACRPPSAMRKSPVCLTRWR